EEKPDYLAVAFDTSHPTFRHEMFTAYKGTRKGMPDELREQVPVMKEVLKAMKVTIIEKPGFEADDILGTLATKAEKAGMDVSLVSGDRDLLQLASERIKIRIPKTKRTGTEIEDYYAKDVLEKYQVTPKEFIDLKGLMGDQSDNIPGVPGVGEKTATKLIKEFQSVENVLENIDKVSGKKLKEKLEEHKELAVMSKELATITKEAPVEVTVDELLYEGYDVAKLSAIFKELGFNSLLEKLDGAEDIAIEEVNEIVFEKADEITENMLADESAL